jgi:hypothetical protein
MDLNAITKALEEAREALDSVEMALANQEPPSEDPAHEAGEDDDVEEAELAGGVEMGTATPFPPKKKPNPFAK